MLNERIKYLDMTKELLHRTRLDKLLDRAVRSSMVTVTAGSGFGKTQAVMSYVSRIDAEVIWITMDEDDTYIQGFWNKFLHALSTMDEEVAARLRQTGFPLSMTAFHVFLKIFTSVVYQYQQVIMVLDDFQYVVEATIENFIQNILTANIENLTLIIISRDKLLSNEVARQYWAGDSSITEKQLMFTHEETEQYLEMQGHRLSEKTIQLLHERCEGWPSAVYLFAQKLKNNGMLEDQAIEDTISDINNLIEQEIFRKYSTKVQSILIKLSVFDEIDLDLLYQFINDCVEEMRHAGRTNPFIIYNPHTKRYRVHYIFKKFLERKQCMLEQIEIDQVYRRAAQWYESRSQITDALRYYELCNDYNKMWSVMYEAYPQRYSTRFARYQMQLIDSFPKEFVEEVPMTRYLYAVLLLNNLENKAAYEELIRLEHTLLQRDRSILRDSCLAAVYILLAYQSMIIGTMKFARYFKLASEHLPDGVQVTKQNSPVVENDYSFSLIEGRPGELEAYLHELELAQPYTDMVTNGSGYGKEFLVKAEAAYLTGNFSDAEEFAYQAIYKAKLKEQTDIVCGACFVLVKLNFQNGNYRGVFYYIEEAREYTLNHYHDNSFNLQDIISAWFFVKIGHLEGITDWLLDEGYYKSMHIPMNISRERLVTAYIHLINGRTDNALQLLEETIPIYKRRGQYFLVLHAYLAQSVTYSLTGDNKKSALSVIKAYDMSCHNNIIMPFIECGKYIGPCLNAARKYYSGHIPDDWIKYITARANTYSKRSLFLKEKYEMEHRTSTYTDIELTDLEKKILRHLCIGESRETIAQELGLPFNSLKYLLKNIYSKLGAINSNDAVRIAIIKGLVEI